MKSNVYRNRLFSICLVLLAACASYSGRGLRPGEDDETAVRRVMGQPAMLWQDADGTRQLSYPRGPMGVHSYMVYIDAAGKLQRIVNVMDNASFGRIRDGMRKEEVLRVLGPSVPGWTTYYRARDELVWEWRYCDDWNMPSRFDVLFDGTSGRVRSTMSLTEEQLGLCGIEGGCSCAR